MHLILGLYVYKLYSYLFSAIVLCYKYRYIADKFCLNEKQIHPATEEECKLLLQKQQDSIGSAGI